ncbi:transmembrane protein 45B-like isoform X3 [Dermacentor albipictus]|uniref:transmembrane protein 45B-like isoform X3 n=1 Tax=Dermacentor albipictus TaxID=60249 RepID=UPI0038FC0DCE
MSQVQSRSASNVTVQWSGPWEPSSATPCPEPSCSLWEVGGPFSPGATTSAAGRKSGTTSAVARTRYPVCLSASASKASLRLSPALGVFDVMTNVRFPFPPYTDYAVLLLAVTVEGLLFHFHLHGRAQLDVLVHTLLVYTIAAEAACILVEMCRPRSVLASLGRACFCLLQATWFWQIGFILYSPLPEHPPWDVHSHSDMMLAASVFTWHIVAVLAYLGALGAVAWAVNRTCGRCCEDASAVLQDDDDLCQALVKE